MHPLIDPRETSICLLTKDPQREYKDLLAAQGINFISRVVGVSKLKGKHKPFEARRQLLKDHGMFLADQRIVPLLPGLLGKMFFDAKKCVLRSSIDISRSDIAVRQPVPVNLTYKDLKAELARAVSRTYMHQNAGTCLSIRLSPLSHSPSQVLANLTSALPEVVKNVEGGWGNVLSVSLKTGRSMSLPVWSCDLGERFEVPAVDGAVKEEGKAKGKKRKADGEEGEKRKKKKTKESKAVVEEVVEEEEFAGFAAAEQVGDDQEDDDATPTPPTPAPPPPKAKKASKPSLSSPSAVPTTSALDPIPLVSSKPSSPPSKEEKPASKEEKSAKVPKPSKKGASVLALEKKARKQGGKTRSGGGMKAGVLGKRRIDD